MPDFIRKHNPIIYYRVRYFHEELFDDSVSVNIHQLMFLVGSEAKAPNFQKVELPDHCICHIRLRNLGHKKKVNITKEMAKNYPWFKLALSLKCENFKSLVIAEWLGIDKYFAVEGKHRVAACTLIEPLDLNFLVPAVVVEKDYKYTRKMFKQPHPSPLSRDGFIKHDTK